MHGHSLLINLILTKKLTNKTLIEIGSSRAGESSDSSGEFYKLSKTKKFNFTTVDMDRLNIKVLKNKYEGINAIHMKGEDFLKKVNAKIDFLYLDAFDFDHGDHGSKRINRYKEEMNCEIKNDLCHQMHLDCVINAYQKISDDGIIVFDDVMNNFKSGKGVTAIPFLLDNGFKVSTKTANCCAFVKS
ncbi:hypothetical protein OAE97_00925 [Verrucomicrobia bacterium]|nr:hypothetical protein [Verrucomicrobiota bacterium]